MTSLESSSDVQKDEARKTEHKKLASVIKGVHKTLRRQFRESDGDYETVWAKHAEDKAVLQAYADAMKCLAEKHWSVYPDSRVDWCLKVIQEYFFNGGMKSALEKDAKRKFHENQRQTCVSKEQHCQWMGVTPAEVSSAMQGMPNCTDPGLRSSLDKCGIDLNRETASCSFEMEDITV